MRAKWTGLRCAIGDRAPHKFDVRWMMIDGTNRPERLARIERLIDEYQSVKRRRIVRRAMRLWRAAEADQQLAKFEAPPKRIH